jgi:outer membrane protein assembly factor BamE (lipoprotein component of BamABCDE complex)
MKRLRKILKTAAGPMAGAALVLASCSAIESTHGYVPEQDLVERVRPGVHDKDSIAQLLGTPTASTTYGHEAWFYIAKKSERLAFFEEETIEQQVLAVYFDDKGIVENIKSYDLKDAEQIALVERETTTRGKELTIMQQLFGNIGRFTNEGTQ